MHAGGHRFDSDILHLIYMQHKKAYQTNGLIKIEMAFRSRYYVLEPDTRNYVVRRTGVSFEEPLEWTKELEANIKFFDIL